MMTFLIFGDVVGKIGREALKRALPRLKEEFKPDLTIVNAENLAHGKGLTKSIIADLHAAGVDFFTSGNHIFSNQKGPHEVLSLIHISEPTRQAEISYAVFCLKKKKR